MFKRKIYNKLKQWKESSNGKTALMIEGPRRVGKSTIAEEFGRNEYKSYILIRFDKAPKVVRDLFDDMSDLNYFFLTLQFQYRVDLIERNSLIIFDEVQLCPKARQAIKALVEDGRFDYLETGSLISIKKNVENILIPSEERKIQMNPMDYEEFLWALNDTSTTSLLEKIYENNKPIGNELHRKLMRDFRLYMLVGGMPQVVDTYINTNNFRMVDEAKRDILTLYEDDIKKIDTTGRLSMMMEAIPSQLNKNTKGFQIGNVVDSYKLTEKTKYTLLSELADSKIVNVCYHTNNPDVDLAAYKDLEQYKLYMADTGLFVTMQFKNKDFTENIIYEKLLNDSLPVNLGYLYENVLAQILTNKGDELFYHTWLDDSKRYEIDFILSRHNKICPIEVKSGVWRKHESIDLFYKKYSKRISNRYIVDTKDINKDKDIICVPIYLAQFI